MATAEPLGIQVDPWESDLTAAEFIHTHFLEQLRALRPHAHQDPYEDPYEACIVLWQESSEWWGTDVFNDGDETRDGTNVYRVDAPPEAKNQISIHTHPMLFPELSDMDVLQLVPYMDDSIDSVGPHHAMAVFTADFGSYHLNAMERTEAGREVNDLETVREHVDEVERIFDEYPSNDEGRERFHQEAARDEILRYYNDAVEQSTLQFKFPDSET